uniref:Uncharacterized protein n=1 Tax=Glossina austeni TaxID=7395 RepID=A0A1A9UHF2_GLOAU
MVSGIYNRTVVTLPQKRKAKKTHNIATYSLSVFKHGTHLKARKLTYTPSWKHWIELNGFTVAVTLEKLAISNIQAETACNFVADEEAWFAGRRKSNNDTQRRPFQTTQKVVYYGESLQICAQQTMNFVVRHSVEMKTFYRIAYRHQSHVVGYHMAIRWIDYFSLE